MADITTITPLVEWYVREEPSSAKFNSNVVNKINLLIDNQNLITTHFGELLPGADAGDGQVSILFALPSAPTGWTRNTNVGNDRMVITSSTGLTNGGSWSISGLSLDAAVGHTHDFGSHTHSMSHGHPATSHIHSMVHQHTDSLEHTHTMAQDVQTLPASTDPGYSASYRASSFTRPIKGHTHPNHTHNHTVDSASPTVTQSTTSTESTDASVENYTGNTGAASGTTTEAGAHTHTLISASTWRPRYTNMLCCKKD